MAKKTEEIISAEEKESGKQKKKLARTPKKAGLALRIAIPAIVVGAFLGTFLPAYGVSANSAVKRLGNFYYQAFGVENDHIQAGPSATKTIEEREHLFNNSGILKMSMSLDQQSLKTKYENTAQEHLNKINEISGETPTREAVDDELGRIERWASGAFSANKKANEAEAIQEQILKERYLWLANRAAARAVDLAYDIDNFELQYNLSQKDSDRIADLRENIQAIYGEVGNFEGAYKNGTITLEELQKMTDDTADQRDPVELIKTSIDDFNDLKSNFEDKNSDPAVSWTEADFQENDGGIASALEQNLRGNKLSWLDIVGLASDELKGEGFKDYDSDTNKLNVVLQAKNKNTDDQSTYYIEVVLSGVSQDATSETIKNGICSGSIKVTSRVALKESVWNINGEDKTFFTNVSENMFGVYTTVKGEVREGSMSGNTEKFTLQFDGNKTAEAENLLLQAYLNKYYPTYNATSAPEA